jgi:hypothetical protein
VWGFTDVFHVGDENEDEAPVGLGVESLIPDDMGVENPDDENLTDLLPSIEDIKKASKK